ncbi:hypothetical protein ACE1B6_05110 [Aerosakkonemataceae cyanobacterium BLCC-F154]|uniref:Tetratricopeptide repeat protein n=1 Tax=Floridaenema fluviatile BLCC-F154 TaxID=3153640 RepID=A0ABV4Y792_9CYAN
MKKSLVFVGLTIPVVLIPNQLLGSHKLLAQQSDNYSLQRQCKAPLQTPMPMEAVAQEALVACDLLLTKTPENSPNLVNILANKAFALQVLGRYEEAIAIWDQVIYIDPQRGSHRANVVRDLEIYSRWFPNTPIQISDSWVKALAEALRLTRAKMKQPDYPVYSDWKLSPKAIAIYSRVCAKQVLLPEQFAADPALARSIVECGLRVFMNREYYQNQKNELEAARSAVAIFLYGTADPSIINKLPETVSFLQEVVKNYQQLRSTSQR